MLDKPIAGKTTFTGYIFFTPACANFFERKGSGLGLVKAIFISENFVCRLS